MKERRKYIRFPISATAEVCYGKSFTCLTFTININQGGIGLYSRTSLPIGIQAKIDIKFKDIWHKDQVETLYGEILYCIEWHLVYVIGIKFNHLLNHTETPALAEYLEQCERLYQRNYTADMFYLNT